jgi:hypothetical protein
MCAAGCIPGDIDSDDDGGGDMGINKGDGSGNGSAIGSCNGIDIACTSACCPTRPFMGELTNKFDGVCGELLPVGEG